jgi:hypothetical protein
LSVTDATGREVRDISGQVLAKSTGAGLQTACWDLRVQPLPAAPVGSGGTGQGGQGGQPGGSSTSAPVVNPFGAGCGTGGGGFGGGGGLGGGVNTAGPFVLPGTYSVALIVDGKTVDTKPVRVLADPDVALSAVERKRMFDMAMELHDLQKRGASAADALRPLAARLPELAKEIGARNDVPADVKAAFDVFHKDVTTFATKLIQPAGAGGIGGGGGAGAAASPNVLTRLGQAKNGLMATMPVTAQIVRGYSDAKIDVPKAVGEAHALFARAATLGSTLAKYNIKLEVLSQEK